MVVIDVWIQGDELLVRVEKLEVGAKEGFEM